MARIIEVTVTTKGEVTVQTKGYAGSDCLAASQFVERALGVTIVDHKTSDFYLNVPDEQQIQQ